MLVLRSDWQAALPLLTQLGNGMALISCLDSMLGAHSDAVNMQMAPLLGVTITADGCMQRVVIDFAQPLVFCHKDPIVVCFLQTFVCSALHTLLHSLHHLSLCCLCLLCRLYLISSLEINLGAHDNAVIMPLGSLAGQYHHCRRM